MNDARTDTELVTVRKFESPFEAHMARTKLESNGIEAVVVDEHLADYNMIYGRTMGGVRLLVRAADGARARDVLEIDRAPPSGRDTTVCPSCGSDRVRHGLAPGNVLLQVLLVILVVVTGLLAFVFLRWRWRCEACGHVWREPRTGNGEDA